MPIGPRNNLPSPPGGGARLLSGEPGFPSGGVGARGRRFLLPAFLILVVVLGACAGTRPTDSTTAGELLSRGEELLARGKYREAQAAFGDFLDRHPSDPEAGRAQLGLARSLLGAREWEAAREELGILLARYAGSPEVEEARYLMGVAYARESLPPELDQRLTWRALEEFEAYRADFPQGSYRREVEEERARLRDKLARKRNQSGWLYLRMGFPDAARIYFEEVVAAYDDTDQAARARFGLAEVLRSTGRPREAEAIYREILEADVSDELREQCEQRLRELNSRSEGTSPG